MIKLIFLVFVGAIAVAVSTMLSVPKASRASSCTQAGPTCRSCSELIYCVDLGGGQWLEELTQVCDAGTTCSNSTASCTTASNPDCAPTANYTFVCRQTGVFPDPLSCYRYHICTIPEGTTAVEPESVTLTCPSGYYFDALTTLCRLKVVNNSCPAVTPACKNVTQSGALEANPSVYYVCLYSPTELYPQFFKCQNDFVYNGTACVARSQPPSAAGSDGKCTTVGYFYDPNNCFNYNLCGGIGAAPVIVPCPYKQYFNTTRIYCIDFVCTDVQKASKAC